MVINRGVESSILERRVRFPGLFMSSPVSIKLGVLSLFAVLALTACSGKRTFEQYKRPESGILLTGADEKNLLTQSRGKRRSSTETA